MNQTKQNTNQNVAVFLVGNKIGKQKYILTVISDTNKLLFLDLVGKRQVATVEGEALSAKYQCHFMEISAKDGQESSLKLLQWVVDRKFNSKQIRKQIEKLLIF